MEKPSISLAGFNNISKSLIASFYHGSYALADRSVQQKAFLTDFHRHFNAKYLEKLLYRVSDKIDAQVLAASHHVYQPLGASAVVLTAEETAANTKALPQPGHTKELFHLDKSHIAAHTYPESFAGEGVATFRIDLDISTCGNVNPLHALDSLITELAPIAFTLDLRFRGFTRTQTGQYCFDDGSIKSLTGFISAATAQPFTLTETNLKEQQLFSLRGIRKDLAATGYTPSQRAQEPFKHYFPPTHQAQTALARAFQHIIGGTASTVHEKLSPHFGFFYTTQQTLHSEQTPYQKLDIVATQEFGNVMLLDNCTQVGEHKHFQYHELLGESVLLAHAKPQNILIIGGGDGGITREVLLHPSVTAVDQADIDERVSVCARQYLAKVSQDAFDDPRLSLHSVNGKDFVASVPDGTYDIIIMDLTDPIGHAAALYTQGFLEQIKLKLKDDAACLALHTSSPVMDEHIFALIHHTLAATFPTRRTFYSYIQMYGTLWSVTVASRGTALAELTPALIKKRITERQLTQLALIDEKTYFSLQTPLPYVNKLLSKSTKIATSATDFTVTQEAAK